MVERSGVYRVLVGKPEGKRPLGKHRRRWEDNINPLNADLNPIRHLLALLGAHHILHVSRIKANSKYHDLYTYVHYQLLGICTILTLLRPS
jgi:hypothetical protein